MMTIQERFARLERFAEKLGIPDPANLGICELRDAVDKQPPVKRFVVGLSLLAEEICEEVRSHES